jgi:hypothetical protein
MLSTTRLTARASRPDLSPERNTTKSSLQAALCTTKGATIQSFRYSCSDQLPCSQFELTWDSTGPWAFSMYFGPVVSKDAASSGRDAARDVLNAILRGALRRHASFFQQSIKRSPRTWPTQGNHLGCRCLDLFLLAGELEFVLDASFFASSGPRFMWASTFGSTPWCH